MVYEVKKKLESCNLSIHLLKEFEIYLRKQADDLSQDYKERIKNYISDCKNSIKEYEQNIADRRAREEQTSYDQQRIEELEESINQKLLEIKNLENELPYNFTIQLEDKYGKELIKSFEELLQSHFDNSVHTVSLEADYKYYGRKFRIKVQFSEKYDDSYVAVKIEGDNAKEKTQGIVHEVLRRTENYKSYHRFFYGKINFVLYVLTMGGLFAHGLIDKKYSSIYTHLYLWFLGALAVYVIVRFISPYCILPTVKNENLKSFKKWGFGLLVTFIIWAGSYLMKNADTIFHVDNNCKVEDNQTIKV
ncbi:MAG: hypothetical protein PHU29_01210 [Sulfuricurvum sp.]|nr:hypothetical protein [Sulfuricurvum sp.]